LAVSPTAEAVEETATDRDNWAHGHWDFVNFCQEVKLWESNVAAFIVESVGPFEKCQFTFSKNILILS